MLGSIKCPFCQRIQYVSTLAEQSEVLCENQDCEEFFQVKEFLMIFLSKEEKEKLN